MHWKPANEEQEERRFERKPSLKFHDYLAMLALLILFGTLFILVPLLVP